MFTVKVYLLRHSIGMQTCEAEAVRIGINFKFKVSIGYGMINDNINNLGYNRGQEKTYT